MASGRLSKRGAGATSSLRTNIKLRRLPLLTMEVVRGMKVVTIIGAGLGGLVSGAMLAQAGMKVRVLEQHIIPGGYATSFRRKSKQMSRPVEFEVSLHLMGDLGDGGALREVMHEIGVLDRLEFMRAHSLYRAVFPDQEVQVRNYDGLFAGA